MSPLQEALDEYLSARRALGHKLRVPGRLLQRFVVFAESRGATYITSEIALTWAMRQQRPSLPNGPIVWRWFADSRTIAALLTRGLPYPAGPSSPPISSAIFSIHLSRRRNSPPDRRSQTIAVDDWAAAAYLRHALRSICSERNALKRTIAP